MIGHLVDRTTLPHMDELQHIAAVAMACGAALVFALMAWRVAL